MAARGIGRATNGSSDTGATLEQLPSRRLPSTLPRS
jgi:hypothetical protein